MALTATVNDALPIYPPTENRRTPQELIEDEEMHRGDAFLADCFSAAKQVPELGEAADRLQHFIPRHDEPHDVCSNGYLRRIHLAIAAARGVTKLTSAMFNDTPGRKEIKKQARKKIENGCNPPDELFVSIIHNSRPSAGDEFAQLQGVHWMASGIDRSTGMSAIHAIVSGHSNGLTPATVKIPEEASSVILKGCPRKRAEIAKSKLLADANYQEHGNIGSAKESSPITDPVTGAAVNDDQISVNGGHIERFGFHSEVFSVPCLPIRSTYDFPAKNESLPGMTSIAMATAHLIAREAAMMATQKACDGGRR